MPDLISIFDGEDEEAGSPETFDMAKPEDVFVWVECGDVVSCWVMTRPAPDNVGGWATYEHTYGELAYSIEQGLSPSDGFWVVEGVTGSVSAGEWGYVDPSSDMEGGELRRATRAEMHDYLDPDDVPEQYPNRVRNAWVKRYQKRAKARKDQRKVWVRYFGRAQHRQHLRADHRRTVLPPCPW